MNGAPNGVQPNAEAIAVRFATLNAVANASGESNEATVMLGISAMTMISTIMMM